MCAFCRIIRAEETAAIVVEDERFLAFLDRRPVFRGRCLCVPRGHYKTLADLPAALVRPLFQTVQLLERARRVSQRALDAQVYLLDAKGQRYDPNPAGQQALDASGPEGQPLDSKFALLGSFIRTGVFDVPTGASSLALVVTHGLFPDVLVIGSDQRFLHKLMIIQLLPP